MEAAEKYEVLHVVGPRPDASIRRARRIRDGHIVLIETPSTGSVPDIERLRRECVIAQALDPAVVLRPVELVELRGAPVLVFEDFAGSPLSDLLGGPIELGDALTIACALAASLDRVHRGGVVHGDLTPQNVLFDSRSEVVKLAGFGHASRVPGEHRAPAGVVEGTPAYMSPEQTGRLSRPIDERSDLYSMGVILYELLTGARPFEAHDVVGWVHSHIVRIPAPPSANRTQVPQPVSGLVMKLLAKHPEERYQTSAGLLVDLRQCLDDWNARGSVAPFVLGIHDVCDRLRIPNRFVGHAREAALLEHTLGRVAVRGTPGVVLVAGSAGVGKSILVHSIEASVVRMRGIFVTGTFQERGQPPPYSAIASALQDVVTYLLADPEEDNLRVRIAGALGPLGQLVTNLVPSFEAIVGSQPAVPELPLPEAQSRFFLVVRRLISAIAVRGRPLVLVVEDLHQADVASLALLQDLVTRPETGHLMVICTYRDDGIAPDHPLRSFLREVRERTAIVEALTLAPLTVGQVTELCMDALSSSVDRIAPLARLVSDRTGGNALSAIRFVAELHRDGLLVFDPDDRAWRWDLPRAGDLTWDGDGAQRTLAHLDELAPAVREAVEIAACLGPCFDARLLAQSTGAPRHEMHGLLDEAVSAGFLSSVGDAYRFLHVRIHETIYEGLRDHRRAELHVQIGRRLLEHLAPRDLARRVFEVARQLNLGASLLEGRAERERVAELDLQAGCAAAASSAYAAAATYLATGAALLDIDTWEERDELPANLHLELARCELARARFDETQRLIGVLRDHPRVDRDRVVDQLQLELALARHDLGEALRTALESLAARGIDLQSHPSVDDLATAERAVSEALAGRSIESLEELPLLEDPEVKAALNMLAAILAPAYLTEPNLHAVIAFRMVELSVRHGISEVSAVGFAAFALELVAILERPDDGRRFADVARRLIERHRFVSSAGKALLIVGTFVAPHIGPLGDAVGVLRAAHRAALDVGDVVYAGYSSVQLIALMLARGDPLDDVRRQARVLRELPHSAGLAVATLLGIHMSFVDNLQGRTPELDEEEFLRGDEVAIPLVGAWFHVRKLETCCIHLDYARALEEAERVRPWLWSVKGQVCVAEYHLFAALAHAAGAREAANGDRAAHLRELAGHEATLSSWASTCPQSFLYMHSLVSAERAALADRTLDAMQHYEHAIHAALDNGFTQGAALAYERAAAFYDELGLHAFADQYLREARARYHEWGAHEKVRALAEQRPQLARDVSFASAPASSTPRDPDRPSLLATSQLISSDTGRATLLGRLTRILLEHAQARRAVFLSVGDQGWAVESAAGPEGGVPASIIDHVHRSREQVLLHDATLPGPYSADPYIANSRPRSLLCLPIVRHGDLLGLVYLENDQVAGVFTQDTLPVLKQLVELAGVSLENARLYTDRKRKIAERQQAESTLRSVLNNMVDGVYICDQVGRITFTNPAGARLIGIRPDERPSVAELSVRVQAADSEGRSISSDQLPLLRALAGEVVSSFDMTARNLLTQRTAHLRLSAAPLQDDQGAIVGALAIAINMTEVKELDRLKDQFVSVVAHELKTPIAIVKGYADVLRRMTEVPESQRRLLDRLVRGADRIDRLVTDLMTVWRLQTGTLALTLEPRVGLVELVELVVSRLDPDAARRVSVTAARRLAIAADRLLLDKVLSNLIDNALRYSPGGESIEIGVSADDGQAVVTVTDHGIGIPKDRQAHLFEPFFRAHTDTAYDSGGIGLGLYISKAIVALHGGSIRMESEEGRGSTFRFALPLKG